MPDGSTIWTMKIRSAGATSLNFVFRNTHLPPNSEMYLYAASEFMVMGPITAIHVHEGIYATDVIYGEEVVIAVRMPSSQVGDFSLEVDEAVHGYGGQGSRLFGESAACNVDVNCAPMGNGWKLERDAVAMIIESNQRICSGALINTACPTLRPLFLTAFHCIDDDNDESLSNSEKSELNTWLFRFNYDSPHNVPNNPPVDCRGPEPVSWLTYSGAVLRTGWFTTDFALLELHGSVLGQKSLALAGWDNNGPQVPLAGIPGPLTSIHHPRGDAKMISIDNDLAEGTTISVNNNPLQDVWEIENWETGTVQGASSGGPLYNDGHRIIGQLLGGIANLDPCDPSYSSVYGRFDVSWDGGGTSDSRLSDILGNSTTAISTTNSIRVPYIPNGVLGEDTSNIICTDGRYFSLANPISSATITWNASPSEYFQNPTGTGSSAFLQPISSGVSGHITLTFTMTFSNNCPPIQMSKSAWVGVPMAPELVTTPLGNPNIVQINVNDFMTAQVTDFSGASPSSMIWKASGDIDFKTPPSGLQATVQGKAVGFGDLRVESSNQCGTSPSSLVVVEVLQPLWDPSEEELFSITPNPASEYLIVEAEWNNPSQIPGNIELRDLRGKVLLSQSTQGEFTRISLDGLSNGILLLQVTAGERSEMKKIILTH